MASDPWSRPTIDDLKKVLDSIGKKDYADSRSAERLELSIPAEIITSRGNTVSAVTREISRFGIGMLHKGAIQPGNATVKMFSDSQEFVYQVKISWCQACENGMFISGGQFQEQENLA